MFLLYLLNNVKDIVGFPGYLALIASLLLSRAASDLTVTYDSCQEFYGLFPFHFMHSHKRRKISFRRKIILPAFHLNINYVPER